MIVLPKYKAVGTCFSANLHFSSFYPHLYYPFFIHWSDHMKCLIWFSHLQWDSSLLTWSKYNEKSFVVNGNSWTGDLQWMKAWKIWKKRCKSYQKKFCQIFWHKKLLVYEKLGCVGWSRMKYQYFKNFYLKNIILFIISY